MISRNFSDLTRISKGKTSKGVPMTRFITLSLAFLLAPAAFAQSGRVTTTPTPQVVEPPTYSESTPQPKRQLPVIRLLGDKTGKDRRPNTQAPTSSGGSDEDVQRVETNLITIPVSVYDRHGLYVQKLQKENFTIFEDGKPQQIEYFGTDEKPFTVIMLLDISPSTVYAMEDIQSAAMAFVKQLKSHDRVMVVAFDRKLHVLTELTGDRGAIQKAITKADFGSGTALYDAVGFSLSQRLSGVSGRKAIVLFTDGVDTQSTKAGYDTPSSSPSTTTHI
jgi:hypothetical protein